MKPFWTQEWRFEWLDKNGAVKAVDLIENDIAAEGEKNILERIFQGAAAPLNYYIRLFNDTPLKADTLTDLIGEPVGNGYAAQSLALNTTDFPTLVLDLTDWQITTKTVTFTASGGAIGPVTHAVLATSSDNTGLHYAFVALSQSRTLADGESVNVSITMKLKPAV